MNEFQLKLWNDLMALCRETETFYYQDFNLGQNKYRIFNYRLASFTEFMRPSGKECRGAMFRISGDGDTATPIALSALPMEKFWNLYECPATIGLDLARIQDIETKADGSLISTYTDKDTLMLKSKGSLFSEQAINAMAWTRSPYNCEFANQLYTLTMDGLTVNCEWCAPNNRIVIGYENENLNVLNIRSRTTGEYIQKDDLDDTDFGIIKQSWVSNVVVDDPVTFVHSIPDQVGIEGFVVRLENPYQRVKIKTKWYLALHHTKDNINSPRRLFEAVIEEATDDMKTLFHDDPLAIKTIEEMEQFVSEKFNHMVASVEQFYEANKHLDRKEYAIAGQEQLDKMFFSLAMNKYLDKPFSYKDYLKSKWKQLGLNDVVSEE